MTNEGAANCWMLRSGSAQREAATSVKRCGRMMSVLSVAPFQTTTTTKNMLDRNSLYPPIFFFFEIPVHLLSPPSCLQE
ncbi:hypothetical protein OUZ56_004594 [Daphnia magna]|uniref:Uncharacterized protein n=1 Tax=Daphnia magna TaxID=35525 RepID=A0ABQ9YQ92_9CRUS|nr:hypothetical protein OUZ56_004594 [Daphnia magna]